MKCIVKPGLLIPIILIGMSFGAYAFVIPPEPTPFWSEAIDIWFVPVGQFGCLMASFDLDKDGKEDYQTQREFLPNGKLWPYPIYYYINVDDNRAVDLTTECWVDFPPDGDTSDVITYTEYQELLQKLEDQKPTDYNQLLEGVFQ